MVQSPVSNELFVDPSENLRIRVTAAQPTPITLEPWGMVLFLLPGFTYALLVGLDEPLKAEQLTRETNATVTYELVAPVTLWLGGGENYFLYRLNGPDGPGPAKGLVWESKRPSMLKRVLTDERLLRILFRLDPTDNNEYDEWNERKFAEQVTPIARDHNRYDIVLLLREHGIVEKIRSMILLTKWGHQFVVSNIEQPYRFWSA